MAHPIMRIPATVARHSFALIVCLLALASPARAQPVLPGAPDAPKPPGGPSSDEPQAQPVIPITRDTFAAFLKARDISYNAGSTTPDNIPYYTMYVKTLNDQQIYIFFDDCKPAGCRFLRFQTYGPPAKGVDLNFVN
jgi:hypothetical protein